MGPFPLDATGTAGVNFWRAIPRVKVFNKLDV